MVRAVHLLEVLYAVCPADLAERFWTVDDAAALCERLEACYMAALVEDKKCVGLQGAYGLGEGLSSPLMHGSPRDTRPSIWRAPRLTLVYP